jgi:hypothetical protein
MKTLTRLNGWTLAEDEFLKANYTSTSVQKLSRQLRRTHAAITTRARDLGVRKFTRSGGNHKQPLNKITKQVFKKSIKTLNDSSIKPKMITTQYDVYEVVKLARIISENQWLTKYLK